MAAATFRLETAAGELVAPTVRVASGLGPRFLGLMGRASLPEDEGLCIQRCSQIHMFFMRFALDVAFVNGDGQVLHVLHAIRPWRISRIVFGAKAAIELPAGTLARHGVTRGTVLKLV